MAALGQLVQFGLQYARRAEDMTQAAIACESIMAEIVAGDREMTSVFLAPYEENDRFVYSVEVVSSSTQDGLLDVHVVVETSPEITADPVSCALVRWMVDPDYASSTTATTPTDATAQPDKANARQPAPAAVARSTLEHRVRAQRITGECKKQNEE
jgi:hypothetical protein